MVIKVNDEIKEILRDLEFASGVFDYTMVPDRCTFLKDYITNLQQENKRLHNRELELSYHLSLYSSEETMLKENKDLQERIEKAVEYIQNHQLVFELSSKKVISQWFDMFYKDTLNILNGRSDE